MIRVWPTASGPTISIREISPANLAVKVEFPESEQKRSSARMPDEKETDAIRGENPP
ncbi:MULTISPECIES: hypothetical protein [unclassified Methanoculleus]|jgi:hypothetical protein|uniref:hypothetical protein n=1 Tax=unclassified Methanoculleus TaxID=2619537 RepID=UPI00316AC1C0|nr:hypothetical protein [Methanoculleus sp.]